MFLSHGAAGAATLVSSTPKWRVVKHYDGPLDDNWLHIGAVVTTILNGIMPSPRRLR